MIFSRTKIKNTNYLKKHEISLTRFPFPNSIQLVKLSVRIKTPKFLNTTKASLEEDKNKIDLERILSVQNPPQSWSGQSPNPAY